MNRKKQKGRFISLKANANEFKMIYFIMEKDGRNSVSDTVRMLIKDRFLLLTQSTRNMVNDHNSDNAPTTEVFGNP